MLEKAKKELNEDPNTRLIEIKTLRERLEKVPGLKCRTDDAFLLRFLRAKKFDQERAYAQVLTFYKMQMEHPDVYENLTPQKVRHILDAGVTGVLKDRAPDGCRVIVYRPGRWDPDKGTIADVLANNFLTMCKLIEEAFPCRFKGIHFLNEPTFFDVVFTIIKQFMKEKMLKRLNVYGNIKEDPSKMKKLHEVFPPDMLPEDYGGKLPPFSNKDWVEKLLACEAEFKEENKYGMLDMTLPSKPQNKMDATEGLGGTFRKLNVD
nr:hypothetical protein BaRGS_006787 [Batillaria attramentaria]